MNSSNSTSRKKAKSPANKAGSHNEAGSHSSTAKNNEKNIFNSKNPTGRDLLAVFFKHPIKQLPVIFNHNLVGTISKQALFTPAEDSAFLTATLKPTSVAAMLTSNNASNFCKQIENLPQKEKHLEKHLIPFVWINKKNSTSDYYLETTPERDHGIENYSALWVGATVHFKISSYKDFLLQFQPITRLAISEHQQILNATKAAIYCFNCNLKLIFSNESGKQFLQNFIATSLPKNAQSSGSEKEKWELATQYFTQALLLPFLSPNNLTHLATNPKKKWIAGNYAYEATLKKENAHATKNSTAHSKVNSEVNSNDDKNSKEYKSYAIIKKAIATPIKKGDKSAEKKLLLTLHSLLLTENYAWLVEINYEN